MIGIDTRQLVEYVQRLQGLSRSAYPVAVRQSLNSAAYDMKRKQIPDITARTFTIRKATFFKANSKVNPATGFDLSTMAAYVGYHGTSQSIDDLQQQEFGGLIPGRSFIPVNTARISQSYNKLLRPNNILKKLKTVDQKKAGARNDKSKFVESALFAGIGGNVLGEFMGREILWHIDAINIIKSKEQWHPVFKLTPLFTYKKGRSAHIKTATHFNLRAAQISQKSMGIFFQQHAEKQFTKALKVA